MTASTLTRGGLDLVVDCEGEGPTMLFQHGLCGDPRQPADVFPTEIGWRRLTLACRGHGSSPAGPFGALSIATFTDDCAALLEADGRGPVVVGGISMGAAIALRLAVTRPDRVAALVLARPAWLVDPAPDTLRPNALVGDLLRHHPPAEARALFEASETARMLAAEAPDNLASLRGFFTREPVAVTAELLSRISVDGPGVDPASIAALDIPTLVIGHHRDSIHPYAMAQAFAGLIPRARLAMITPKADDPLRYRDDFRRVLADFLKEQSP